MRKQIVFILFSILVNSSLANNIIRLEDCYTKAEKNYPLINQKELIEKMDEFKQLQLKRNYLPLINVNLQASYQSEVTNLPFDANTEAAMNLDLPDISKDQYKASLDIQQLIWDGGIIREQKKVETIDSRLNQQNLEIELYKIKDQVNQLFFNSLLLEKQIGVLELSKKNIENNLQKLNDLLSQGMALKSEIEVLKAEAITVSQQITALRYNRSAMIQMLGFLMGSEIKPDQKFEFHEAFLNIVSIQIERPEIEGFVLEQQKQKATMAKIEASKGPQISGNGQIGYGRPALNMLSNDFEPYYKLSLNLRWNLWDWNKRNTDKDLLNIRSSMIDYQRKTFEHNVWVKYRQNNSEISKLESFLEQDKAIIKLRAAIRESAENKLANGTLTSADYLNELNKETQSKLNFEYHKIQLALAKINLKYLLGQL